MADDPTVGRQLEAAPTLALVASLQDSRRARDARGLFFVEGVRNFVTAADAGAAFEAVVYSERLLTAPIARMLVRQLRRAGVPYARVTPEQYRSISRGERASGVGAVLRQRRADLGDIAPGARACWLALRHVRSPGNLGTLLRSATAVGADGLILLGELVDPYHPATVRASMGALFAQTLARASPARLRAWADAHGIPVVGASPDGPAPYTSLASRGRAVILLGEERAGLTAEERAVCDELVSIPMAPGTDSLNLGVAGSLLLYEVFRT